MDTSILEDIGLTNSEIRVYLILSEIGSSMAGPIIEKTHLQSSVVHKALKSLIEKGLVQYVIQAKVRHYKATDARQLIDYIEGKKKKLNEILPEILEKQASVKERQLAAVYEGIKGVKTAFNDILRDLKHGSQWKAFVTEDQLEQPDITEFFLQFDNKRAQKKVKALLIVNENLKSFFKKAYKESEAMTFRFTEIDIPTGLVIAGDKLMITTWGEKPSAFMITSSQVVKKYTKFFDSVWKAAEK